MPPSAPVAPPPAAPGTPPGGSSISSLRTDLEADIGQIEQENGEIDMLMEQVLVEIERHETRRSKVEQRLATLETTAGVDPAELAEARDSLLALTRREMLFDAQRQVLEGKQRVLARYLQKLVEVDNSLAGMAVSEGRPVPLATAGVRALAAAAGGSGGPGLNQPAMALRSQEDMRRDIVRQLHDGPAQSIANIGLQAEIVERLLQKGDPRSNEEMVRLRELVQQALDTTKEFIFDIRPMVLDDLGLAPTIRRIADDKSRRTGIDIDFVSQGVEQRLDPDIESVLYRSIDEAISGYLALEPPSVVVRMDWSERELVATVEGAWPRISPEGLDESSGSTDSHSADTPPALLAMMEEERSAERKADIAARSLPAARIAAIQHRARALGLRFTIRDDGQLLELVAPIRG